MKNIVKNYIKIPTCKCNSDTFLCDKCGLRMLLKIRGDSTSCRNDSCNGTMYRQ
ncbi:MAG: hypothetical protein IJE93_01230 [Clostridia bacterium]|nr:hypothetical protein [Clostridia bacterium]